MCFSLSAEYLMPESGSIVSLLDISSGIWLLFVVELSLK